MNGSPLKVTSASSNRNSLPRVLVYPPSPEMVPNKAGSDSAPGSFTRSISPPSSSSSSIRSRFRIKNLRFVRIPKSIESRSQKPKFSEGFGVMSTGLSPSGIIWRRSTSSTLVSPNPLSTINPLRIWADPLKIGAFIVPDRDASRSATAFMVRESASANLRPFKVKSRPAFRANSPPTDCCRRSMDPEASRVPGPLFTENESSVIRPGSSRTVLSILRSRMPYGSISSVPPLSINSPSIPISATENATSGSFSVENAFASTRIEI